MKPGYLFSSPGAERAFTGPVYIHSEAYVFKNPRFKWSMIVHRRVSNSIVVRQRRAVLPDCTALQGILMGEESGIAKLLVYHSYH